MDWTREQIAVIAELRRDWTMDERLWLARMLKKYGIEHVVRFAESYKLQVEQARTL